MPIATIRRTTFESTIAAALTAAILVTTSFSVAANTRPFVWARAGDALTLDPHAVNEGTTHTLNHHIYEPLIVRTRTAKLEPALAMTWTQTLDPMIWIFQLREDVTFHDGQPMTADDVVFSLQRAMAPTSDLRSRLQGVKSFRAVEPDQVEITTFVRDPLLPIRLTDIFIMSKAWATANGVTEPQNYMADEVTFAARHANGTGPFRLVSREAGKETKLARNDKYWGWSAPDTNNTINEIIYRPITDNKDRITALLEGSVDFVQDVPLSELEVLRQAPDIDLNSGPENRVIFLGLSVKPETADGKPNPLHKVEARQALALAIDRLAIQRTIMLGQSIPTGVLAPPGINGFPTDLDEFPVRDVARARAMLTAAGVPEGSQLTMDCPTNRYVNDAAICTAIVTQLAEVGLKIDLRLHPKEEHFKIVRAGQSQLYLLGWGVPTFDSAYIFKNLFHSRTPTLGTWNGTGFSDPELDKLIVGLSQLNGTGDRARLMTDIWFTAHEAAIYVPLHVQTLMYAMRKGVVIDVDISNTPKLKYATVDPSLLEKPAGD